MSYRIEDVVFENGPFWVLKDSKNRCYTVYRAGLTHSTPDSSYPLDDDGLSLATARANYLFSRLMADDRSSMDDIDRAERILEDLVAEAHYNSPEGRAYRAAK